MTDTQTEKKETKGKKSAKTSSSATALKNEDNGENSDDIVSEKYSPDQENAIRLEKSGARLLDAGKMEEGADFLRRAAQLYKKTDDRAGLGRTYYHLGYALEQQKKLDEAVASYRESKDWYSKEDDKKNYSISADRIAKVYYWQGKILQAVDEYKNAVAFGCEFSDIYNNLAFLQIEMEKFGEARENLEKSIKTRKNAEDDELADIHLSHNNLGIVEFIDGNYEKAKVQFEKGIEEDKRSCDEDRTIQYCVFYKPEYKGETFKKYRVFENVDTKACMKLNLASTLAALGKKEESIKNLEEAMAMDSGLAYPYEVAGWVYLSMNEEKTALEYFKQARPYDAANEDLNRVIDLINPYINVQVGRNDPCPCGSGKKYKKCHGASV